MNLRADINESGVAFNFDFRLVAANLFLNRVCKFVGERFFSRLYGQRVDINVPDF
jgi:hypothetical protein